MSRRTIGLTLMVAGGALVVVALIGMFSSGDPTTAATSSPQTVTTTATSVASTTTSTAQPTTTTSTTEPSTTSMTAAPPTPAEAITAFVTEYRALIDSGDADGLFDRLHPLVLDAQDADLCRAFIEREILALVDYRLTGDVSGPVATTFGSTTVEMYTAPVAFTFQGSSFDADASFAIDDGEVRWFTTCR